MRHEKPLLDDRIIGTLSPAIGRKLAGVMYCCLEHEAAEDDITDPEFYFGGGVRLRFDSEYVVWVTWDENAGWEQHFSVSALTEGAFREGALQCFEANSIDLWKPFVGAVLKGFDIMGWEGAPDVIRLSFGFGSVLTGIGYQGHYRDGDDVFARPDTARYLDGKEKILLDYHQYSAIVTEFNEKHRLNIMLCKSCPAIPACLLWECLRGLSTYSGVCKYG